MTNLRTWSYKPVSMCDGVVCFEIGDQVNNYMPVPSQAPVALVRPSPNPYPGKGTKEDPWWFDFLWDIVQMEMDQQQQQHGLPPGRRR